MKWRKNVENLKTIFIVKLETLNIIQNEFVYVYMKYHSNRSLFTQLCLHSITNYSDFNNF